MFWSRIWFLDFFQSSTIGHSTQIAAQTLDNQFLLMYVVCRLARTIADVTNKLTQFYTQRILKLFWRVGKLRQQSAYTRLTRLKNAFVNYDFYCVVCVRARALATHKFMLSIHTHINSCVHPQRILHVEWWSLQKFHSTNLCTYVQVLVQSKHKTVWTRERLWMFTSVCMRSNGYFRVN